MVIDGMYYALALAAGGGVVSYLAGPAFGIPLYLLAAFCLYFFRDPERIIPEGDVAVSPADGKVLAVTAEAGDVRIGIFMNVFDVHVNRAPIAGLVSEVKYKKGEFLVASRNEAVSQNEQNLVVIEGGGSRVAFNQIAGLIARRIVCYKKPGDNVERGERVGLIKFGSRVDVVLGPEWAVEVKPGERVKAGSSVLARRR
jgi:phosphatidylserine decarboxylase